MQCRLCILALLWLSALGGCSKERPKPPVLLDFDALHDGDYQLDRKPPFIPSQKLSRQILATPILLKGGIYRREDGVTFVSKWGERRLSPLRVVRCQESPETASFGLHHGQVIGDLIISPIYVEGELQTVYLLKNCRFTFEN